MTSKTDTPEKAKLLPEPVTYNILCALPEAEEKYENGLAKADVSIMNEQVLSVHMFVLAIGPDAFKDPVKFPHGPSCKVGDFIIARPNSGTRLRIYGKEFRLIDDDQIQAVVQDPRGISRY